VEVLRVANVLPQVQVTSVVTYSGWMSFFMVSSRGYSRRVALDEVREPEPASKCAIEALAGANRAALPQQRSVPGCSRAQDSAGEEAR
jgi:hypothetical protein